MKAIGKMFHPEHFICDHCGKQIANESFHLDSGKPYCAQDYKELFCVKCCSCKQVIGGGDRWLEALDKPWHADCFRCAVRSLFGLFDKRLYLMSVTYDSILVILIT